MRYEIKRVISVQEYAVLSARIKALMHADGHMQDGDGYRVTSLYFDDIANSAYNEKAAGVSDRKKYRIRVYNLSNSVIRLEKKEKHGRMIDKKSAPITRSIYESIIHGGISPSEFDDNPLCREFFCAIRERGERAAVIVDYIREAYVHPLSDTRITFDRELSAPINTLDLFAPYDSRSIFPAGQTILEIKYNQVIPAFITDLLRTTTTPTAASKYVMCRDKLAENFVLQ